MAQEFKVEFTKYQSEMNHLLSGLDEQQPTGSEGGSPEVDEASAAVEALSVAAAAPEEEKAADTATTEDKITLS